KRRQRLGYAGSGRIVTIGSACADFPLTRCNCRRENPPTRYHEVKEAPMGQRRNIAGSRILITGASQGIGKALAEAAAARGAKVLVCARKMELLQDLAQQIRAKGGVIEIVQADITNPHDRQHLVETAEKVFGGLDIL